jgi:hypothetical protein
MPAPDKNRAATEARERKKVQIDFINLAPAPDENPRTARKNLT